MARKVDKRRKVLNKSYAVIWAKEDRNGVSDGNRTRDIRSHNPVLYQLSYTHHCTG